MRRASERGKIAVHAGFLIVAVIALLLALCAPAPAHDFWINHGKYKSPADGSHCCGDDDCHLVDAGKVKATPRGWLIEQLNQTVPYAETQASEDGKFWLCERHDGSRRCFFAPQPST